MEALELIDTFQVCPSIELMKQNREVKKCQWCQIQSINKSMLGSWVPYGKRQFSLKLLETRLDIKGYSYGEHEKGSSKKVGVWVRHIDDHEECYRYTTEVVRNIFEFDEEAQDPPQEVLNHKCPGHKELYERYWFESKAIKKGLQQAKQKMIDPNIQKAEYWIWNKDYVTKSVKKKYFTGLLPARYAVILYYKHHDASSACPKHPCHVHQRVFPLHSYKCEEVYIGSAWR